MNKNFIIFGGVGAAVLVGAVLFFVFFAKKDPLVAQAKTEVGQAQAAFNGFQNTVNAIPVLELSQDVKNDFKIQANYIGLIGYVVPDAEPSLQTMRHATNLAAASDARDSSQFHIDLDAGLEDVSKNLIKASQVTRDDLSNLEKLANSFDIQVAQARQAAPTLVPLTVERTKNTEKYFLEFERIQQKLNAFAASLTNYSSASFKEELQKLKEANGLFTDIANYTAALVGSSASGYPLDASGIFPDVADEEEQVQQCALRPTISGCAPSGPFPGGYQKMLQKLELLYKQLIEY